VPEVRHGWKIATLALQVHECIFVLLRDKNRRLSLHGRYSREYERVVDPKYLDQIRTEAKQVSNKLLSRRSRVARSATMNFKKGTNTIKPRTLRKLTKAVHDLQDNNPEKL
jgi:hypothetical protein